MYVISACLAGRNCKYNGGNNESPWVLELINDQDCVLVCPESLSGLSVPRPPAEIRDGRVFSKDGTDVTEEFTAGAKNALLEVEKAVIENNEKVSMAILKARSPSCGSGQIYDGTFTGKVIEGDGLFAAMLKKKGVSVITEEYEPGNEI